MILIVVSHFAIFIVVRKYFFSVIDFILAIIPISDYMQNEF